MIKYFTGRIRRNKDGIAEPDSIKWLCVCKEEEYCVMSHSSKKDVSTHLKCPNCGKSHSFHISGDSFQISFNA